MIITLTQGSPEWLEFRRKSIGASCASIIMDANPWRNKLDLYNEMVNGHSIELNDAMKRGMALEENARIWCEKELEACLFPVVMRHGFIPFMHASFDGMSMDESIAVEIKCPGMKTHEMAKKGSIPEYYKWQMYHQMEVGNLDFMYYCSYMSDDDAVIIRFDRDDSMIEKYMIELDKFWKDHIEPKNPPTRIKNDEERIVIDESYGDRFDRLKANLDLRAYLKQHIAEFEKLVADLEENIIKECQGSSIEIGSFKVTKYQVKGSVQYDCIPELKTIDLEAYRKPSREQWRIS